MSDITYITSLLDTTRFSVSPETSISLLYFTSIFNRNVRFFIGKELSYVIELLKVLFKQWTNVV